MPVARQVVGIGRAHRAEHQPVAHRAAVDEEILRERVAFRVSRQCRPALEDKPLAPALHRDGVLPEVRAQHIAEPCEPPRRPRQSRSPGNRRTLFARQRKRNIRPAHREPAHHVADRFGLGAIGLEKLEPRGGRVEQVAHLDARAFVQRCGSHLGLSPGIDLDRPGMRLAIVPRRNRKPCDRADRWQRLATKTERRDRQQVVLGQL